MSENKNFQHWNEFGLVHMDLYGNVLDITWFCRRLLENHLFNAFQ